MVKGTRRERRERAEALEREERRQAVRAAMLGHWARVAFFVVFAALVFGAALWWEVRW